MKQGAFYIRVVLILLLLALGAYGVFAVGESMRDSLHTVTAIAYEAGEGFQATGFVVRDEQVVTSASAINVYSCAEGERVKAGAVLASAYTDQQAQQLQGEIDDLQEQVTQLQYVIDSAEAVTDESALDTQILADLKKCAVQVARRNLSAVDSTAPELKSRILRRYVKVDDEQALLQQISALRSQLSGLQSQLTGSVQQITAPVSGYFSAVTDGYETLLSAGTLKTMTVAQLDELGRQSVSAPAGAIGKLITSGTWYFVCAVSEQAIEPYHVGDRLSVSFAYDFYETAPMQIERIGEAEDGRRLVVLSCDEYLAEATGLRAQSADLVSRTYSGLRVPKNTVHYSGEQNTAGVYVLEGNEAKWKPITILYENEESYIVKLDKSSIGNLWPGDEILDTTQELSDGKVVY